MTRHKGVRVTHYRRCQVEVFARFGECARWDGLVQRVTRYADDARGAVSEVHEAFERRRDKLVERRSLPLQETLVVRARGRRGGGRLLVGGGSGGCVGTPCLAPLKLASCRLIPPPLLKRAFSHVRAYARVLAGALCARQPV